jgi:hypothetical protein
MARSTAWLIAAGCAAISGTSAWAQQTPATPPVSAGTTQAAAAPKLSDADLEEMLAPIALYPDTLLASTLAACVYEEDFKAAAKFVAGGGKADQIASKDWDPSVKAVAAMPEVIKLLGDNTPWAVAVGQAYLTQGKEVMAAVQSLRARAWANGALKSTPQQTVVTEGQVVVIEPADPQVIYVPTYSPAVVYAPPPSSGDAAAAGVIGFGLGLATAAIIANNMDCDWHGGCVGYHGDVNVNVNRNTNINNTNINAGNRPGQAGSQWQPNQAKMSPNATSGGALNSYKGAGSGGGTASVPGRTAGSKPIASGGAPPAPKPRTAETARPSAPTARSSGTAAKPDAAASRPSGPAAKPDAPAARPSAPAERPSAPAAKPSAPASRPSAPAASPSSSPRSSGFNPSSGGGSRSGGGGGGGGGRRGR